MFFLKISTWKRLLCCPQNKLCDTQSYSKWENENVCECENVGKITSAGGSGGSSGGSSGGGVRVSPKTTMMWRETAATAAAGVTDRVSSRKFFRENSSHLPSNNVLSPPSLTQHALTQNITQNVSSIQCFRQKNSFSNSHILSFVDLLHFFLNRVTCFFQTPTQISNKENERKIVRLCAFHFSSSKTKRYLVPICARTLKRKTRSQKCGSAILFSSNE
jgi:hypothetical protein